MTPPALRILAYATSGVIESIISYEQLTHINYAFLTPNADGTFSPSNNGWELEQIVQAGHARKVKVMISVGGWGWDQQFQTMAGAQADEFAYQGIMFWTLDHNTQGEFSLVNAIYQTVYRPYTFTTC